MKKRKKKSRLPLPSSKEIDIAIEEFLENGGKIERLEIRPNDYERFMSTVSDVDTNDF